MFRHAVILCALAAPAFAEECGPVPDVLAGLAANYGEAPRVSALMGEHVLIITAAPNGGWTALEVKPTGEACIVASGQAFEVQDAPPQGNGA